MFRLLKKKKKNPRKRFLFSRKLENSLNNLIIHSNVINERNVRRISLEREKSSLYLIVTFKKKKKKRITDIISTCRISIETDCVVKSDKLTR